MIKFVNNYLASVALAEGATAVDLDLPDGEYLLTLADSQTGATRWEIVRAVVAGGAAAVERGQQGTSDQPWAAGSVIYCALTAGTIADMLARLTDVEGIASGPLVIIDELASVGDLPVSGSPGDAYLVAGHVWIWATGAAEWVDAGSYRGEQGEQGDNGRAAEFQASATHIQWRLVGDPHWIDLLPLSAITGEDGIDGTDGADGRDPEFQASATHLQYRLTGDTEWVDLLLLSSLQGAAGNDGADGREIELQTNPTHIQYRYTGEAAWTDLVALAALKGDQGDTGADGVPVEFQASATHIQWRLVGAATWTDLVALSEVAVVSGGAGGWDALIEPAISSGVLVVDLTDPAGFAVTLTEDVTTLTFSNVPAGKVVVFTIEFTQDGTGGWAITWPASVQGTPEQPRVAAGAVSIMSFYTRDGGATVYQAPLV